MEAVGCSGNNFENAMVHELWEVHRLYQIASHCRNEGSMEAIGRWTAFEVPIGNFGSLRGRETANPAGQATGPDGRYRAIRPPLRASKR